MSSLDPSPTPGVSALTPAPSARRRRLVAAAALAGAFAVGGGLTALTLQGRPEALVALPPAAISAMRDGDPAAVKGRVAEIFGNKFVVEDESGRALVETGRAGEGRGLVAKAETVTVQGRFERGFLRATAISHADGRSDIVGPPGPPPHRGALSWRGMEDGLSRVFARHAPPEG